MIKTKLAVGAMLIGIGIGTSAFAAAPIGSPEARADRMDSALQDYRSGARPATTGMRADRSSNSDGSVKQRLRKTGTTIKEGAKDAGHAVANSARSTSKAVRNANAKARAEGAAQNTTPSSPSP